MKTPSQLQKRAISFTPFLLLILAFSSFSAFSQDTKLIEESGKPQEREQAISLLGKALYKPILSPEAKSSLTANYNKALKDFRANPGSSDAHIWLGRRLAYLGDYTKAIRVFTDGVYYFPNDARFLRHRGHRFITIRMFDQALKDFESAAEMIEGTKDKIEPDGAPNAAGIPVSSLHSNIWYHLGLTQYLLGDFEGAFTSYKRCYDESTNKDKEVSSGYWLYLISERLGEEKFAEDLLNGFKKNMKLIENFAYHEMLMFYKSEKSPEEYGLDVKDIMSDPTRAYGLGIWYLNNGDKEKALEIFNKIIKLPTWASFGYIAAEAELARMK